MPGYIGVIVESPSKCSKIESYLGQGYKCAATYGHIRELRSLSDIASETDYKPRFKDSAKKTAKISALRRFIAGAKSVLLATDDDREGEAIAWHICDRFNLPVATTPRIVFHEITKTAVVSAVASPTFIDMRIVRAQQARQVLDLLVGFTVSPLLWRGVDSKRDAPLSAGRCQSPALRLVYDNQKEINEAPGEGSYATTGYFTSKHIDVPLSQPIINHETALTFVKASKAFSHNHQMTAPSGSSKAAPLPFTTSLLQQKASSELKLAPKGTMEACQILYEQGLITYHRTDMQIYAGEFVQAASLFIRDNYGSSYVREKVGSASQSETAQAAHEAIRPTSISVPEPGGVDGQAFRVYKLIYRNTLESCMADARYESFKWTITAAPLPDKPRPVYRRSFEKQTFAGWQAVSKKDQSDPYYTYVLSLAKGNVNLMTLQSSYTIKKLKQHLTEAKLVSLLEKAGIGRPSTFSSLVDKIQTRKYVKKGNISGRTVECPVISLEAGTVSVTKTSRTFGEEKGKLVLQELGSKVMDFLVDNFDSLFGYGFTKGMEARLDDIARGVTTHEEVCRQCHDSIKAATATAGLQSLSTVSIDQNHTFIIGKFGPCIKCCNGTSTTFLRVKAGVTAKRIQSEKLTLEQIVDREPIRKQATGVDLGEHLGNQALLKNGRFGPYVRWRDRNYKWQGPEGVPPTKEELTNLLHADVKLTTTMTIKRGKFGPYILRKKSATAKPTFIPIPNHVDVNNISAVKTWLGA